MTIEERITFLDAQKDVIASFIGRKNNYKTREEIVRSLLSMFKSTYPEFVDPDGRINDKVEIIRMTI